MDEDREGFSMIDRQFVQSVLWDPEPAQCRARSPAIPTEKPGCKRVKRVLFHMLLLLPYEYFLTPYFSRLKYQLLILI